MTVPLLYDALWVVLPLLYIVMALIVLGIEVKSGSDTPQVALWTAAQLFLPGIGLIAWFFLEVPRLKRLKQDG